MKIEVYQREDGSQGIYIAGDLTAGLPKFIRYREFNGTEWHVMLTDERIPPIAYGVDEAVNLISSLVTQVMKEVKNSEHQ